MRVNYVQVSIIHIAYFAFGIIFDILFFVVIWQIVSLFYKFSKNWIYKNWIAMPVGIIGQLGGSWSLVGELPEQVLVWMYVSSFTHKSIPLHKKWSGPLSLVPLFA